MRCYSEGTGHRWRCGEQIVRALHRSHFPLCLHSVSLGNIERECSCRHSLQPTACSNGELDNAAIELSKECRCSIFLPVRTCCAHRGAYRQQHRTWAETVAGMGTPLPAILLCILRWWKSANIFIFCLRECFSGLRKFRPKGRWPCILLKSN